MTIITKYSHTTHIAPDKFTTVSLGAEPRPRPRLCSKYGEDRSKKEVAGWSHKAKAKN